jgi:methylmalonyl-CoA mutase cobalamin-binding subunit
MNTYTVKCVCKETYMPSAHCGGADVYKVYAPHGGEICECWLKEDAEGIARVLNANPGAMEVCRDLAALCEPIDVGFDVVAQGMNVTTPASIIAKARIAIAKSEGRVTA